MVGVSDHWVNLPAPRLWSSGGGNDAEVACAPRLRKRAELFRYLLIVQSGGISFHRLWCQPL